MSVLNDKHTNEEWLDYIQDLYDLATVLKSKEMVENAETVYCAIELLLKWNPEKIKNGLV